MNIFMGIGNLGSNPTLRRTDSGRAVSNFNIAIDRVFYRGETKVSETDWIPVVAWGNLAETTARYCRKGSKVAVRGEVRPRSYTDSDGISHRTFEVVADTVEFLNGVRSNADVETMANVS